VTGTSTIEEQLSNLLKMVEKLTRTVEEKDVQIAELYSKLEDQNDENSTKGSPGRSKVNEKGETSKNNVDSLGSLSLQQLQDIITNSIRAQYGGPSRDSPTYSKPYTRRINGLRMPSGY
jgi:peptidoglycan hydrolase CwlO-like protein